MPHAATSLLRPLQHLMGWNLGARCAGAHASETWCWWKLPGLAKCSDISPPQNHHRRHQHHDHMKATAIIARSLLCPSLAVRSGLHKRQGQGTGGGVPAQPGQHHRVWVRWACLCAGRAIRGHAYFLLGSGAAAYTCMLGGRACLLWEGLGEPCQIGTRLMRACACVRARIRRRLPR